MNTITTNGDVSFDDDFTASGNFPLTITSTAATNATLPSGTVTLVDLSSSQNLTNKTYNGLTITSNGTNTLNIAAGGSLITSGAFSATATVGVDSQITIFSRETMGDANKTFSTGKTIVSLTSALTSARVLTLPAANAFVAGTVISFIDEAGGITSSNTITATCSGADTVNGNATLVFNSPYVSAYFETDGSAKWTAIASTGYSSGSWSPTWTGFSANPTSVSADWSLLAKACTLWLTGAAGTSNGTTLTVTLPFAALRTSKMANMAVSNGTQVNGLIVTTAGSNILTIYTSITAGAFASSGGKLALLTGFTYPIA